MFGIGISEIIIIVVVILIFVKPEDIPVFFRKAGRLFGELKRTYDRLNKAKDDFVNMAEEYAKKTQDEAIRGDKDGRDGKHSEPEDIDKV